MQTYNTSLDYVCFYCAFSHQYVYCCSFDFAGGPGAYDMYEGLQKASSLFVEYTIGKFEEVKMLHIILLVITLVIFVGYVVFLFRPYVARVHNDSKHIAGFLSQLPAEVDVEGHVKAIVLNMVKAENRVSMRIQSATMPAPTLVNDALTITGPGAV